MSNEKKIWNDDVVLKQLRKTEAKIKPEKDESFRTKSLHYGAHITEFVEFITATTAILYNPLSITIGIAAFLGIIANILEWQQLTERIEIIEADLEKLESLVNALEKHQSEGKQQKNHQLVVLNDPKEDDILKYLIQQPQFLEYFKARRDRDILNLERLRNERKVSTVSIVANIAFFIFIALTILLKYAFSITIGINIEPLFLCMIMIDKLVHGYYTRKKTQQASDELTPLKDISKDIKNKLEIKEEDILKLPYFGPKLTYTRARGDKRQWKQWIRGAEALCAILAFGTALVLLLSQLHWIPLTISASHIAIQVLVYGAMGMDGVTKFFWTLYQRDRFKNKEQQALINGKNQPHRNIGNSVASEDSDYGDDKQSEPGQKQHCSFLGTPSCLFPQVRLVRDDGDSDVIQDSHAPAITVTT